MAYTINWDMVSALARNKHVPKLKDNFFLSNALFYRWKSRVRDWTGGPTIVVPLSFAPEGGGGSWYSGTDKFDTSVRNPIKAAQYFPKNAQVTVAIDSDEELAVTGPEAVMNLVAQKMRIAERTAVDLIGTNLYNDGSNPKAITGLQYALKDTNGQQFPASASYGGILAGGSLPASDPNGWWQHNNDGTGYTCGSVGATFMYAQDNPVSKMWGRIALRSGEQPSIILSNWGAWSDFHNSMARNERYDRPQQQTDLAKAGFRNLMYRSAPWVADERAPRASDVEKVYLIDEESLGLWVHPRRNMEMEDWRKPIDQDARVAYIFWRGEMCFDERRSSGVINQVTTTAVLSG
jgi:hypothetical protein